MPPNPDQRPDGPHELSSVARIAAPLAATWRALATADAVGRWWGEDASASLRLVEHEAIDRVVLQHGTTPGGPDWYLITVTLQPLAAETRVAVRLTFPTPAARIRAALHQQAQNALTARLSRLETCAQQWAAATTP